MAGIGSIDITCPECGDKIAVDVKIAGVVGQQKLVELALSPDLSALDAYLADHATAAGGKA